MNYIGIVNSFFYLEVVPVAKRYDDLGTPGGLLRFLVSVTLKSKSQ